MMPQEMVMVGVQVELNFVESDIVVEAISQLTIIIKNSTIKGKIKMPKPLLI